MAPVGTGIADTVFPVIAGHIIATETTRRQIQTIQIRFAAMRIPACATVTVGVGIEAVDQRTNGFALELSVDAEGHILRDRQ